MSLDFDLAKIKDYKKLFTKATNVDEEDSLNQMTERLIFLAMEVDLGEITEKNVEEWMVRLAMLKRCGWAPRQEITRADIERHVGLKTNVWSMTRVQFRTKLAKHIEHEAMDDVRKAKS